MSRRTPARSVAGLIVEIGVIALVVAVLPKFDLRPKASKSSAVGIVAPARPPAPAAVEPWWDAAPAASETSWQPLVPRETEVNVEQTLDAASRQLISGVSDYASRAAAEMIHPPAAPQPIQAQPRQWPRY